MYKPTLIDCATTISITGAVLVSMGFPFYANLVWMISNPYMAWYNHKIGQVAQTRLFAIFAITALYGVWNLW